MIPDDTTERSQCCIGRRASILVTGRPVLMYFLVEDRSQSLRNFYIVGEKLGQGTFGTVRLVSKRDTGEEFAVKTIDKQNLDQDELNSLSLEIDIISQIDHPNIVKTFEVYDEEDSINIVMECMTGGELFDRVRTR